MRDETNKIKELEKTKKDMVGAVLLHKKNLTYKKKTKGATKSRKKKKKTV